MSELTIDADFAKCTGETHDGKCCPIRYRCFRYLAKSRNPQRQVMIGPEPGNMGEDCREFWPVEVER